MRKLVTVLAGATVTLGVTVSGPTGATVLQTRPHGPHREVSASPVQSGSRERRGDLDTRAGTRDDLAGLAQSRMRNGGARDLRTLRRVVGPDLSVSMDPVTGTPRNLTAADGYLTAASTQAPARIAMGYVARHLEALGLTRADLATFRLRTSNRDPMGITHLSWSQTVDGVPVFGNGLRAHVSRQGRLISLQGSPVPSLRAKAQRAAVPARPLSAPTARRRAVADVGGTLSPARRAPKAPGIRWRNGDSAARVWFVTPGGVTPAWSTVTRSGNSLSYAHVLSASNGRVLYRKDLTSFDRGDAPVYDYYPGAPRGGEPKVVNFVDRGWLDRQATWLTGRNVVAWSDVDDDNAVSPGEKTRVQTRSGNLALRRFDSDPLCSSTHLCTWDPNRADSWRQNRAADVANAFYLANNYHDYLAERPIYFTAAAGNFETAGKDPVLVQALDGADTADGLPDGSHVDNANMDTPPDGQSPVMQMYLWHSPGADDADDPFLPTSGAFDASVLYHEYTHGLSNRLVVDAGGNSTLNSIQAGSMGEAWSDYYALDYLVTKGLVPNTRADGEVLEGQGVSAGQGLRTEAIDCRTTATGPTCTGLDGRPGGYTYGDFPTIGGSPEVHSSGELWAQTLWDIRSRLGHTRADSLITRAMQLSPDDPSMLDMRNAVLQADQVGYADRDRDALWDIFANRGMGWYAGAIDGSDVTPAEDFHARPATRTGTLTGQISDPLTGKPLAGVLVHVTGHDSGYLGSLTAVTDANGRYSIADLPVGTYPKVVASADGYEVGVARVTVTTAGSTHGFGLRRDAAARSGGASIVRSTGADYSAYGCGPEAAIDLSQGTGWGSSTGNDNGDPASAPIPKTIVIKLPRPVDIGTSTTTTAFSVDPTATCGDPGSASTATYRIEVSTDRTTWTTAVDGTGARAFTAANRYAYTDVPSSVAVRGVSYVRYTMLSPQVPDFATNCPDGPFAGCSYMDTTEVEVFGTPTR